MTINVIYGIIVAGIVQGFIFASTVLVASKKQHRCLVFLALLDATKAYSNFQYILPSLKLLSSEEMYAYVFLPIASLAPALLLLFVKTFLEPNTPLSRKQWYIFVPFVIFFLAGLVFKIVKWTGYTTVSFNNFFADVLIVQELVGLVMMLGVSVYTLVLTFRYSSKKSKTASQSVRGLLWLKVTLFLLLFGTVLWGYAVLKQLFFSIDLRWFLFLWVALAFLIYWLGYAGRYKFELWLERKKIRQSVVKTEKPNEKDTWENPHLKQLEKLMKEDKLYLDSQLSLESVAAELGISPSHLSRLLNQEGNIGFAHYLNAFRVDEAIQLLGNASFNRYTMTAIGLESGFKSKSAFFRIFKEKTGQSPSAYQKNQLVQTQ